MPQRLFSIICLSLLPALLTAAPAKEAVSPPTAITPDGGRYWGPLVQGIRQGQGRVEWPNGSSYVGSFAHGLFSGKGIYRAASGEVWEGEFVAGVMSGPGKFTAVDGSVLEGQFRNGHLNGKGHQRDANGGTYEGEFRNDYYDGQGHFVSPDQEYRGQFKQGMFSGKGKLRQRDGDEYEGDFARGEFSGKGRYTVAQGPTYEGNFVAGKLTGHGVVSYPGGARHEGAFVNWQPQGPGTLTNQNGFVYQGVFKDGQLAKDATVTAPDGARYRGELQNWQPQGQGELLLANGDLYKGGFSYGEYMGQGTLVRAHPKNGERKEESGIWQYGRLKDEVEQERQRNLANTERALYTQTDLLNQALAALQPHAKGTINMYLLAIAGDGTQEVFRREVDFVGKQFDERYGTRNRSILLVNSRNTVGDRPLATVTSIRKAIAGIAARMDRERDILFVYLTSHGSRQGLLSLELAGAEFPELTASELATMLREAGIHWKVVAVSSCYSGNFLAPLRDPGTLVITAARADRTSFGCNDENDFTYFGRAFFKESLPTAKSFEDAFQRASKLIASWEERDIKDRKTLPGGDEEDETSPEERHSLPQIEAPAPIHKQLQAWQAQQAGMTTTKAAR